VGGVAVVNEGVEVSAVVTATLVVRVKDYGVVCEGLARVTDGKVEVLELERFWFGWGE